jgi:hypothetical protein
MVKWKTIIFMMDGKKKKTKMAHFIWCLHICTPFGQNADYISIFCQWQNIEEIKGNLSVANSIAKADSNTPTLWVGV